MINIDTRIDEQYNLNESEFWLLYQITKRMFGDKKSCFPSLRTIQKDTSWGRPKVVKIKRSLEKKGLLKIKKNKGKNGGFMSDTYILDTDLIGVFMPAKKIPMVEEKEENTQFDSVTTPSNETLPPLYDSVTTLVTKRNPNNISNVTKISNVTSKTSEPALKEKFGELENVLLTSEEHQKLIDKTGSKVTASILIDELSLYLANYPTKYKNHYATLLQWFNRRQKENALKTEGKPNKPTGNFISNRKIILD